MIGYYLVFVYSLGSSRRIAWALVDLELSTVATLGVERCISAGWSNPKSSKDQYGPTLKIILERYLCWKSVQSAFSIVNMFPLAYSKKIHQITLQNLKYLGTLWQVAIKKLFCEDGGTWNSQLFQWAQECGCNWMCGTGWLPISGNISPLLLEELRKEVAALRSCSASEVAFPECKRIGHAASGWFQ